MSDYNKPVLFPLPLYQYFFLNQNTWINGQYIMYVIMHGHYISFGDMMVGFGLQIRRK